MAWPRFLQRGALLSGFSHHHVAVFLLTFFSYSLLHASRKTFSNVKVSISKQWTPNAFNTSVDLPAEVRRVFVFGTLTEWLHFYNKWLYCGLWIVNGLLQSTGWPCVVAVMGNWFGKAGLPYAFLVTASVQFAGGIVIFFGLLVSPEEIDSHRPLINGAENEDEYEPNYSIQEDEAVTQVKAISFHQACCLPGVIPYSLAYACLKLVNYSFFFWLPFYLSNNFGWKEAEADKLSIWYDVGGIVGTHELASDRFAQPWLHSTDVCSLCLKVGLCKASSLICCRREHLCWPSAYSWRLGPLLGIAVNSPNNKSINALLMTITGFFIGGPSNMISSAISADLGRQELIQGSSEALATVTGIVDGTGSIGAAVGQYLVSLIQDNLGWMWVFYFFILMTSCTILFISPLIVREVFSLVQRRQAHILSE
ncbi:hypothetical protein A6R68_18772 [Neotoma lepida]|uniref:Sugar phosphate exchanger 3 n=1 Tax=Neotoma lepida TaxID=56216 RepID=A0A1A6HLL4_NEOLE|nr:hypothetical protein A6R68_18772 [Neotoma lepida]